MDGFDEAIRAHDDAVAAAGLVIWVGGEPTFSDRTTFAPEWSWAAHGQDKEARARRVIARLHARLGGVVLRTLGRQYAGEDKPRWSYGLWSRRDGAPVWAGPPDPLQASASPASSRARPSPTALRDALAAALQRAGCTVARLDLGGALPARLVFRTDGAAIPDDPALEPELERPPVAAAEIPESGAIDALAQKGSFLVGVGPFAEGSDDPLVVELPAVADVPAFGALLDRLAEAATAAGCEALVLEGHVPPVDRSVHWLTVTPDPGVLEVNMAPATDVLGYLEALRLTHEACAAEGLSPSRWLYSGEIVDSGGGGHVTLGGPSPEQSPFLRHAHLLPALVAYTNRHPCLSYLFTVDSIGSSSQSPRADENVRESFDELGLALERLAAEDAPDAATLWASLAPFLVDRAGNCHRAEINVEKLWNPCFPGRGKLGVVELRAFRMARSPERGAAIAALMRAVVAMLARERAIPPLCDWGDALHDRFALPFHLERDLDSVLFDMSSSGMALSPAIVALLRDDEERLVGRVEVLGHELVVRRALELWPLVGDSAHMERSTSRTVDPSTRRLELRVRALDGGPGQLDRSELSLDGYLLPMVPERDERGEVRVLGVRYRGFVPRVGLHPGLGARAVLSLRWHFPDARRAWTIDLHGWRPGGGGYEGLPQDGAEAARRVAERFVVREVEGEATGEATSTRPFPPRAVRPHHVDLRRL